MTHSGMTRRVSAPSRCRAYAAALRAAYALAGFGPAGVLRAVDVDPDPEIVERYAVDPAARARIHKNRIYQQISETLAGAHEYAAMVKLYGIAREERHDLIVLDTPPTANALDFLDAPEKVTGAIDSPAIQWLMKPYLESGGFSMKLVGMGGAFVLKRLARFVGSQFLADMAGFLVDFDKVLAGFRERAREVFTLLRQPDSGFVLVCSPDPLTVDEAVSFHARLREMDLPLGGFVVNRVHPAGPPSPDRGTLVDRLESREELRGYTDDELVQVASDLDRTYRDFQALAEIDGRQVERLRALKATAPIVEVPLFDHDIHDVDGLSLIDRYLVGGDA